MTALVDLPEEILAHICSYLSAKSGDIQSLSHLSRCSRQLHRVAEDSLYHAIEVYADTDTQYCLPHLIRTLLARPRLAAKIKKLLVTTSAFFDEQPEESLAYDYGTAGDSVFVNNTLVAACINRVVTDTVYELSRAFWIIGLARWNVSALVGFLLTLLPNLNDLSFEMGHSDNRWSGVTQVLEKLFLFRPHGNTISPADLISIKPLVDFSNVKRLYTHGTNLEILALGFPNLQQLELNLVDGGENHAYGTEPFTCDIIRSSEIIPPYPQLQALRFYTDWEDLETHLMATRCVAALFELVCCNNLITFEFRLEHGPRNVGDDRLGSWDAVIQDLQPAHRTIESLVLDVVDDRHWFFDISKLSQFDPIESLHHLSCLRRLAVPQSALFNDANLINPSAFFPPSLQDITIRWPTEKITEWLRSVAVGKSSGTLGIHKIQFVCDKDYGLSASWLYDMIPAANWDDVRNAGIEVEVIDMPGTKRHI